MKKYTVLSGLIALCLFCGSTVKAYAAPHYLLVPSTKSVSIGDELVLDIKMESGTVKVAGADILLNYDSSKLDYVEATPVTTSFVYDSTAFKPVQKGTQISVSLIKPNLQAMMENAVVSGVVMKVKFKAKAAGTALVSFECKDAMINESNILEMSGQIPEDKIACLEDVNGSYEISAIGGQTVTSTPVPASSTTTTTTTTTPVVSTKKAELPKTGNPIMTIGLMIIGTIGMVSAFIFKAL